MIRGFRARLAPRSAAILISLLAATSAFGNPPQAPPPAHFATFQPGGFTDIQQTLQINLVFVGFEPGSGAQQINQASLNAELPQIYKAIHRVPDFYGFRKFVGTTFNYSYNYVYADTQFENAFFGYLASIADAKPRTTFQENYNAQISNTLDVGQNHWIEAPAVEKWLANNAGAALGINTAQYTVFFVNWYGRADFKFHVYSKTDEPDSDTGANTGAIRDSRKMIAWGGTPPDDPEGGTGSLHRIWFYDLSAGPEAWTGNFDVDTADLTGDGVLDYRMPPSWEYGSLAGYRPFDNLSGDLGKVTRYVALDLLFTTSPLYNPALSAPRLPGEIELDLNLYQGDPNSNARYFLNASVLAEKALELQPFNTFSFEVTDLPFNGRAEDIYDCFLTSVQPPYIGNSCYGNRFSNFAFADLFLYHDDHLNQFVEGDGEYEIPIFVYNTNAEQSSGGVQGYADDDWRTGTQSYIYVFEDPIARDFGFGITDTTVHEVGHHLGMSHAHDGYDYESNYDFSAYEGPFTFAWSGDQSNSVMGYLFTNNEFSQFDRDNMNRYMTATYINQANAILPRILSSPRVGQVTNMLNTADNDATSALGSYGSMNYSEAAAKAKLAYLGVIAAAGAINVQIEPQSWNADYRSKGVSPKFVDLSDGLRMNLP